MNKIPVLGQRTLLKADFAYFTNDQLLCQYFTLYKDRNLL